MRVNGPVFFFLKRFDFALTFNNQAQRHGLHASGGKAATDFVPQQRRDLITHNAVQHAARLLRVHQVAVDIAWMLERLLHRFLGDLIKGHAMEFNPAFFLFLAAAVLAEFFFQMRGNGFAFAVRVRRQIHGKRAFGQLLQFGHNFFFSRDDDVLGGEIILPGPRRAGSWADL